MSTTAKARSGRSKTKVLPLPSSSDDAAERKRVLNILANRRYRQRKRELLQDYERQLGRKSSNGDASPEAAITNSAITESEPIDQRLSIEVETTQAGEEVLRPTAGENDTCEQDESSMSDSCGHDSSVWDSSSCDASGFGALHNGHVSVSPSESYTVDLSLIDMSEAPAVDTSLSWTTSGFPTVAFDAFSLDSTANDISGELQSYEVANQTFPDEVNLPVWEMILFRGLMDVSKRLCVDDIVYSITALSPFPQMARQGAPRTAFIHLPTHLQPTTIQLSVAHHPVFDLLPWPSVRSKLITIFALPAEVRPPMAASPTALSDLIGDMDDSSEGVKLHGDPFEDCNYEIGERMFRKWWFAFDSDAVRKTNERRQERGETSLGQGSILGPI